MYKGVLSFASVGHAELHAVLQDAYDRWTWERVQQNPVTGSGWRTASHCSTQARHAALAHIGRTPGTRCFAVCVLGHDAHAKLGIVWKRFSLDRSCQLCQAPVGSPWHRYSQVLRICRVQTRLLPGLRSGQIARPHAAFGSGRYAGGPLFRPGRPQAYQARVRRLGGASREGRARNERFWRRLPQARAPEGTGTWGLGTGCAERRDEGHGEAARPAPWPPPGHHSGGKCQPSCGTCGTSGRWAVRSTRTPGTCVDTGRKAWSTAPEGSSFVETDLDISFRWNW